jgi:hypothetical protein
MAKLFPTDNCCPRIRKEGQMAKKKGGILTDAKDAVVGTGAVVADTAKAGFEGAKSLAVSAGSAVGGAVTAVAKKARKVVSRKKPAKKRKASRKPKRSATGARRTPARKTARKKPARKFAKATGKAVKRSA